MQSNPKISIVTPAFNCGHLIHRCIESVSFQDYPNVEHIIIDGGSTDGTVEVLKKYPHLRWISEPDNGEAHAVNKGIRMATGDIICWLNADDYFCPHALNLVAAAFAKNAPCDIVYGHTNMVDETGRVLWFKQSSPTATLKSLVRWWNCNWQPHQPSMFFSRQILEAVGPLNEQLHFSIDFELWLRCAVKGTLVLVDETLSCATHRMDSKSFDTQPDQIRSHWRVIEPYLAMLSREEIVEFWQEYYMGLFSGLNGNALAGLTQKPGSEEALFGLIRVMSKLYPALKALSLIFPDQDDLTSIAQRILEKGLGFKDGDFISIPDLPIRSSRPREKTIVIDGIFFERAKTGIYRLWAALLQEWSKGIHARRIVVLDRSGCAPRFPGIRYRLAPPAELKMPENETAMLEAICEQENAGLFVSTYYTSVRNVPSVMPLYDMIPEKIGMDLTGADWTAKHVAIRRASAFCCISESTRRDFLEIVPNIDPLSAVVIPCGIDLEQFSPARPDEVAHFRRRHGLTKPYFMLVGGEKGYKNAEMVLEAMRKLPWKDAFQLLVTRRINHKELLAEGEGLNVVACCLQDEELPAAYSGAAAFVYPSKQEGFGLPILEAMACDCPVITSPWSSLPEVAGAAALYASDATSLADAMMEVLKPSVRSLLLPAGQEQVRKFRWDVAAAKTLSVFDQVIAATSSGQKSSSHSS
jgi:glycosyltransferase involved in cell wall biosynthesis